MSLQAHYAMVQEKHVKLESMIDAESHRPLPDIGMLQTLKKQKLLLKEELEYAHLSGSAKTLPDSECGFAPRQTLRSQ